MIDFKNASFFKLRAVDNDSFAKMVNPLLTDGEQVISSFCTIRDGVVFTDKRIIAINVQGVTGNKRDFTSLPYSKIQAFSVETAGVFDIESELEVWFSTLGVIKFEFCSNANVSEICRVISERVL